MDCQSRPKSEAESAYLDFVRKVMRERIPVSGDIEITRRCNFDCIHCYLGSMKCDPLLIRKELTTGRWIAIIDEIAAAGCLFLLFTGGEPLLRKDFTEIYLHARKQGIIVTVFTNGSLISEPILEAFVEYPPHCVEVSLYGSTEATYEAVTRRSGMLEKCVNGIRSLVNAGVQTRMKTILMTANRHEFSEVEKLAEKFDVKFRFDGMIFPCLDGDRFPTGFRVSPEEIAERNMASSRLIGQWRDLAERMKQVPFSDVLYDCGAGVNSFHIDPAGVLRPCLMINDVSYDLLKGSFRNGWRNRIPETRKKKIPLEFACKTCNNRIYCGYCPAFFKLETGSETEVSPYLCELGQRMGKQMENHESAGEGGHVTGN
jgi:radical SAM protein with 4Fe4S-binding SPASM domain